MKLTENRWLTGKGFGVHSPWAYDLIENVINERHPYYAYEDLYPFWEKAPQYLPQYPQSRDELLFRLVNRFNPRFILEVGTGAGVSTGYLASVSRQSRVVTVDYKHPAEKSESIQPFDPTLRRKAAKQSPPLKQGNDGNYTCEIFWLWLQRRGRCIIGTVLTDSAASLTASLEPSQLMALVLSLMERVI
jgi:hypothetical protein